MTDDNTIELRVGRPPRELFELRDKLRDEGYDAEVISEFHAVDPHQLYEAVRAVVPWDSMKDEAGRDAVDAFMAYVAYRWHKRHRRTKLIIQGKDGQDLGRIVEPPEDDQDRANTSG